MNELRGRKSFPEAHSRDYNKGATFWIMIDQQFFVSKFPFRRNDVGVMKQCIFIALLTPIYTVITSY